MRVLVLLTALALCMACASPGPSSLGLQTNSNINTLDNIQVDASALSAAALCAELSFLYPEETRAVMRNLMRSEFAKREAERLGLVVPNEELADALQRAIESISTEMGENGDFTDWCISRYQRSRPDVVAAIRQRLADNMLYQLCVRASATQVEQIKVLAVAAISEQTAQSQSRKLKGGADPFKLEPPARVEEVAIYPQSAFVDHVEGQPFQLPGDRLWHVLIRQDSIAASSDIPPVEVLLEGIRQRPIGALEARAWWDEMQRRYTAHESPPLIQSPARTFVDF